MKITRNPDRFYFDGQLHIPVERIEETISVAMGKGLNALFFTNYGNTTNFDYLVNNRDAEGRQVLTPQNWDVQQKSPTVLKLSNEQGIYMF
jgi:hypothetical protein